MKKSWKKEWIKELDERVPKLDKDVLNAPIYTNVTSKMEDSVQGKVTFSFWKNMEIRMRLLYERMRRGKRFVLRFTAMAAALLLLFVTSSVVMIPEVLPDELGAFALEINPRAIFAVNTDGIVTSVVAGNADADVILSSERRKGAMTGKTVSRSMEIFVDYAAQLGYLDMETGDAIRVSMCMRDGDTAAIRKTLTDYFCKKGVYVAVITQEVSVRTFCDRVGAFSHATLQELVEAFEVLPSLYSEREAEGKTVVELQAIYEENIAPEDVKSSVESILVRALEWITKREESLKEIAELNDIIKKHEDNPKLIFKDYWSVKEELEGKEEQEISLRFTLLLQAMEDLITAYEEKYNVTIDSEFDLKTLQLAASSEYLHGIAELLADFSMEVFNGSTKFLTEALEWMGVKVDLEELCEAPQTTEEYLAKTKTYNEIRYRSLQSENITVYGTERERISTQDYNAYLQTLCDEYGSLEAYWETLNS